MITTLRFRSLRLLILCAVLLAMALVAVSTAQQQTDDDRQNLRTKVAVQDEKLSAIEEWRRGVDAAKNPERLATLESQMAINNKLLWGILTGLGALIIEMITRLVVKSKKE